MFPSFFKLLRLCSITLILTALLLLFPKQSFAQDAEEVSADNYKAAQHANFTIINLVHTLSCLGEGKSIIGQQCVEYLQKVITDAGQKAPTLYAFDKVPGGGAVGAAQGFMLAMYSAPPARGTEYLASIGQNFGLTKPTYAQTGVIGSGNQVISPVFALWQAVRNLAYTAMIIIFVIVGFMIMFRRRLNPQTVVSIQLALPRLVVGLIMITFSYFISSLIIDIGFAGAQLVGFFFLSNQISSANANDILNRQNVITIFSSFIGFNGPFDFAGYAGNVISNLRGMAGTLVVGTAGILGCIEGGLTGHAIGSSVPFIGSAFGTVGGCAAGSAAATSGLGVIISTILYVVLLIALLAAMFSTLMSLITNYVQIVIYTILSPLQFLMAALPGGSTDMWFRNMLANVLPFPAVFAAFYLVAYFIGPNPEIPFNITAGSTPFEQAPPLLGAFGENLVRLFLAYGLLLAIPSIPKLIFRALTPVHRTEGILEGGIQDRTSSAKKSAGGALGQVPIVGKFARFI